MKNLLFILAFLTSIASFGQTDTVQSYNATINIPMPNDSSLGVPLKRQAKFKALVYDEEARTINIQWEVSYMTMDSVPVTLIPTYKVWQVASENVFIFKATGLNAALTLEELLTKYGVKDENGEYKKRADGKYLLTQDGIMDGYSYYNMAAQLFNIPINTLMKVAGMRAANEGRLNIKH